MKRGGTEAEVATAMALAAELARKHNIDLDGVNPDQDGPDRQPLSSIDAITSSRITWECKYAGLVCEQFFNVSMVLARSGAVKLRGWNLTTDFRLVFVGTRHDISIAQYVFDYLVGHFRRSWNNRSNKRLRNRRAFLYGMYHGLCYKLDSQREKQEDGVGLIKLDQQVALRKQYVSQIMGETTSESCVPDCDAAASKRAGAVAGRSTEIRAGISGGDKPSTLLLK